MTPQLAVQRRMRRWWWVVLAVVVIALTSCGSSAPCRASPKDPACPDLKFRDHYYDEWRDVRAAPHLQELGDGTYPACNDAEQCGPHLGGFGATDVWLVEGVNPDLAVIGIRQDGDTYVVFVRRGIDPGSVPGLRRAVQSGLHG